MPSGKTDVPVIEDNRDGTVSIKYEPREEGSHELLVKYNGEHVQGNNRTELMKGKSRVSTNIILI